MATIEQYSLLDMFRADPVQSALFTLLPLVLALGQLANSVVNGVSFFVSVPFALVVLAFAALATQYSFVRFQRRHTERNLEAYRDSY